jgi:hypothetical protein
LTTTHIKGKKIFFYILFCLIYHNQIEYRNKYFILSSLLNIILYFFFPTCCFCIFYPESATQEIVVNPSMLTPSRPTGINFQRNSRERSRWLWTTGTGFSGCMSSWLAYPDLARQPGWMTLFFISDQVFL